VLNSGNVLLLFAGATVEKVWLMIVGRFLFGIGGASLAVAQNTFAVLWFKGKELNFVFGLQFGMITVVGFWRFEHTYIFVVLRTHVFFLF